MDAPDETLIAKIREIVRSEVQRVLQERERLAGEYLSTQEAAALAGVSQGTLRRWFRRGRLTKHGAGRELRVRRAELEKLMLTGYQDSARGGPSIVTEQVTAGFLDLLSPRRRGAGATLKSRSRLTG